MPCARLWISSQRSAVFLPGKSSRRTRGEKTSAPPPGMDTSPASFIRPSTSSSLILKPLAEVVDFSRRPRLDVNRRESLVDASDNALVPLERPVRVMAAHNVYLVHLRVQLAQDLVHLHLVGAGVALLLGEIAEGTREDADVGGVDLTIEDEVDLLAPQPALGVVGHLTERHQVRRVEAAEAVLEAEPLAVLNLVPDGFERSGSRKRMLGVAVVAVVISPPMVMAVAGRV